MAVRFVIGRAGSGKTYRCFHAIVESMQADPLGPNIYWLVPKQSTFTAERELTCNSGLHAFCRARVVSFEGLGEEILSDCGGGALPEVTATGRQMLIGHLLRKNQSRLKHFTSVAHHAGLAAELDTTFAEIERRGKSAPELAQLLGELESGATSDIESAALVAKVHDIHLIYDAYRAYLGADRLDPHGRLTHVLSCIERCSLLAGSSVYVDGFLDFTDYERRVLVALAKACPRVEITLLCDPASPTLANPHTLPDELNLFHRTEQTYRALWFAFNEAGVNVDETLHLSGETNRFHTPALSHVEHNFDGDSIASNDFRGIELIEAPDRRAEVDAAARQIRAMLKEGFRLRDIGVLSRTSDDYIELIDASFREHDIDYFADRRRTAAHHPLVQFTRSALAIVRHTWPHDAMMTLIKTGLAGASADDADELENYVLEHRIRGRMWASPEPWLFRRRLTSDQEITPDLSPPPQLDRANDIRGHIVDPLRPFVDKLRKEKTLPVREIVCELFLLFESFKIRQTLGDWMSEAIAQNRLEERGEHEQVWSELISLFDQMVDLLGEEPVTLANFQEILEVGLERFDLALTPPAVDQVLVGQIDRTRTSQLRAVIVLGLNESQFPLVQREDTVFSDAERRSLTKRKVDLDPDTTRRLLDERLLGYIAFTRATEQLYVTRSLSQPSGRPCAASPYWRRLREIFPKLEPTTIPRESAESLDHVGTPRQLVTAMMKWVRNFKSPPEKTWAAVYDWLATYPCHDDPIDRMRYRAWKALSYSNTAALSPEIARQMFPSPLSATVSQIETFASCPFRHFLRYGLRLRNRPRDDVTAADLGGIFHQVLERIVRDLLSQSRDWTNLESADAEVLIASHAAKVGRTLRDELMMSSARNKYLLDRIERTLAQVIASQRALAQRGRFRPAHASVEFGANAGLPPYRVGAKSGEMFVHGKIDRVDLIADAGDLAVIDYRLGGDPLALDRVYHGISLQLLTYLLVLQSNGATLAGKPLTPAAAFYLQLLRRLEDVRHPDDATPPDDPAFDLQVKPRGIFDGRSIGDLDADLTSGTSDVIHAHINKDGAFGRRGSTDVADTSEFAGLLRHVEGKLAELADQMLAGDIAIAPYRLGRQTPCPNCEYRSVCRFDAAINRYHNIPSMKREDVLTRVKEQPRVIKRLTPSPRPGESAGEREED